MRYVDAANDYQKAWTLTNETDPRLGYELAFNYLKVVPWHCWWWSLSELVVVQHAVPPKHYNRHRGSLMQSMYATKF